MLYTNYKQVARLVLQKSDADSKETVPFKQSATVTGQCETLYKYNINLPYYKFSKNTKLAVDSFSVRESATYAYKYKNIGNVFIKNIKKSNVYHSDKTKQGTCILSCLMARTNQYVNPNVLQNSIDITGNTSFLEGNELELIVDTKIISDDDVLLNGCPEDIYWTLTLLIYEEEKEENPKDYVDDKVKNYSKPSLY
jgi:hypothetical protein